MDANPKEPELKRSFFAKLVLNDFVWACLKKPIYISDSIKYYRAVAAWKRDILPITALAQNIFSDLTVKNGPFKGLKYSGFIAICSSIFPKLLGSYEKEIHPLVEQMINEGYSDIIDVGCAEGFYAIGFALKIPDVTVYAYDTNSEARDACKTMAQLNNVADRVKIDSSCTAETLKNFKPKRKALIFCDVDGFEKQLFSETNIQSLSDKDILIETHDCYDKTITKYLKALFAKTHNLTVVDSLSDHLKVMRYEYKELEGLNYSQVFSILEEGRPGTQEWFFFTPK